MSQDTKRPRGRPPDPKTRDRILRAAHELLLKDGLGRLTVEAVATRARVGKPTVYRYWANAQELALAALIDRPPRTAPDGTATTARDALEDQLDALIRGFTSARGRQVANVLAASDTSSELSRAFRHQVILASRTDGQGIIDAGVASGEWTKPDDPDALLDMIYGALFYRLLVGHQPLEASLATSLADIADTALSGK